MTNNNVINEWGLDQFMDKAYTLKSINLIRCNKINYKSIEKYKREFKHNQLQIKEEDKQKMIDPQLCEFLYIGE